jgi:hypothetical protein
MPPDLLALLPTKLGKTAVRLARKAVLEAKSHSTPKQLNAMINAIRCHSTDLEGWLDDSNEELIKIWSSRKEHSVSRSRDEEERRTRPRQPALDVKPLAREVADLIENRISNERLKWRKGEARVQIGKIIPSEHQPKETLTGRRRRFRKALSEELEPRGWREVRPNVFHGHQPTD